MGGGGEKAGVRMLADQAPPSSAGLAAQGSVFGARPGGTRSAAQHTPSFFPLCVCSPILKHARPRAAQYILEHQPIFKIKKRLDTHCTFPPGYAIPLLRTAPDISWHAPTSINHQRPSFLSRSHEPTLAGRACVDRPPIGVRVLGTSPTQRQVLAARRAFCQSHRSARAWQRSALGAGSFGKR